MVHIDNIETEVIVTEKRYVVGKQAWLCKKRQTLEVTGSRS